MNKILHVIATLERAGTEVTALNLVTSLLEGGYRNEVVALKRGGGEINQAFQSIDIAPIVIDQSRAVRLIIFWKLIRRCRPDAVIFHFYNLEHVFLGAVCRIAGIKRIVTVQGNPAPENRGSKHSEKVAIILRLTRWLGIRLVSVSKWIEDSLKVLGGMPHRHIVIHNGSLVKRISRLAAIARANRKYDTITIGMVARLDPIKDYPTLIEAFALLPSEIGGKRLILKIIGEGVQKAELEQLAHSLQVFDRVEFLGVSKDVPSALGKMDVFALSTTRDEGFGVVLVESLAACTPIIASDVPACREVLSGRLGVLVPQGDSKAMADALLSAIIEPCEVPAIEVISSRYGMNAMRSKYLEFIFDE